MTRQQIQDLVFAEVPGVIHLSLYERRRHVSIVVYGANVRLLDLMRLEALLRQRGAAGITFTVEAHPSLKDFFFGVVIFALFAIAAIVFALVALCGRP